jgi:hypothetical protein
VPLGRDLAVPEYSGPGIAVWAFTHINIATVCVYLRRMHGARLPHVPAAPEVHAPELVP